MFRVRTVFTGVAGSPYYSNFYFAGAGSTLAQGVVSDVRGMWADLASNFGTPMVIAIDPDVPDINPVTGDIQGVTVTDPGATIQCQSVAEKLPTFTQMLVTFNTNEYRGGRQVRGRCFIPGWTIAANTDNGLPDAAYRATVQADFNVLAETDSPQVVWSRKYGEALQVTSHSTGTQWAVLRSRRD